MDQSVTNLYKKDGEGFTMKIGVSRYKNQIITHPPVFSAIPKVLDELEQSTPRRDDVWIMAYGKSGTHWVYEIVGILLSGELQSLTEYKVKSMIELKTSFQTIEEIPSPRVINTHARVQFIPEFVLQKCKLICVMRNPKSVAVSCYHHIRGVKGYDYDGSFNGFYDLFMHGSGNFSGTWFEYVTEWWDAVKGRDNVLIVYYEDLKKCPLGVIQQIASFIGVKRDETFCKEVVNLVNIDTMKTQKGKDDKEVKMYNNHWKNNVHQYVRKGVIADWKNYFTVSLNEDFDRIYEEKMKDYFEITDKLQYE